MREIAVAPNLVEDAALDSKRGLLLGVRARVRAGRGLHAAGDRRRPRGQRGARSSRWRKEAHEDGVAVAVFPELCLTGYAIDDLFLQDTLLDATLAAIDEVVAASGDLRPVLVVGAPLVHGTRVLNCAVVIQRGRDPGRRAEVLPADLPRVLRAPLVRAR